MSSASIDEFLHDSTFLGKFISSFTKRQELNNFLSILLNPMITSIENKNSDDCLSMSLFAIQKSVRKDINKPENKYVKDANIEEEYRGILSGILKVMKPYYGRLGFQSRER